MKRAGSLLVLVLLSSCCPKQPPSPPAPAPGATSGVFWVNHHDMVVSASDRITLSNNGTALFVKTKPNIPIVFPEEELVSLFVPTVPPGRYVTGVRVCYGIVGDQPNTEVHRLRLTRFDTTTGGGTHWPGYLIALEDTSTASAAPSPPAGGFAFDDAKGFLCVDSTPDVCLDPSRGTISPSVGIRIGDADDHLVIMAIGLRYDTGCTPS